jgi:alcohol dehydrogenase class IV
MGVNVSDINNLAKNAINDACMYTNPRPAIERDIEVIYEEAL